MYSQNVTRNIHTKITNAVEFLLLSSLDGGSGTDKQREIAMSINSLSSCATTKQNLINSALQPPKGSSQVMNLPPSLADSRPELYVSCLQQGISAYIESVQNVSKTGCWLADSLSVLLEGTDCQLTSAKMKKKFLNMFEISVKLSIQAKNDLARLLMELTLPNHNNNNHNQAMSKWRIQNSKVLEKCIFCLEKLHSSVFGETHSEDIKEINEHQADDKHLLKLNNNKPENQSPSTNELEWKQMKHKKMCINSWKYTKHLTNSLRKSSGLTEGEIQNLLKPHAVAESYKNKLNQKISAALKEYETALGGLALPTITVRGAFSLDQTIAREVLANCCNLMEIEQGIQRPPVKQFLHCELPLTNFKLSQVKYSTGTSNSTDNAKLKKDALSLFIQTCSSRLAQAEVEEITSEILGDLCPARWRCHVKAVLQLMFGNSGLVVLDTIASDTKHWATVERKGSLIIVSVPSIWSIKEDPGTMILLHRNVDPEKKLFDINVRYVAAYNLQQDSAKKKEPVVYVEVTLMNGKLSSHESLDSSVAPVSWLQKCDSNDQHTAAGSTGPPARNNRANVSKSSSSTSISSRTSSTKGRESDDNKPDSNDENSESEAIQDAIKLLSVSLSIKKAKLMEKSEAKTKEMVEEKAVSPEKPEKSLSEGTNSETKLPTTKATTSSHAKSKTLPTLRQSSNTNKNPYNHLQRYPKSASFSAFDRANFKFLNKPLTVIHPAVSPRRTFSTSSALLQTVQQQPVMYIQPNVVKHPQMQPFSVLHTANRTMQADPSHFSSPVLIQSHVSNQVILQPPLTQSSSPNTFSPTQNELLQQQQCTNAYELPQNILRSSSEMSMANVNSVQGASVISQHFENPNRYAEKQGITNAELMQQFAPNTLPELANSERSTPQNDQMNALLMDQMMDLHLSGSHGAKDIDQGLHQQLNLGVEGRKMMTSVNSIGDGSSQQNNFGPIGSPAPSRRLSHADDNKKGSNTWPHARQLSNFGKFATNNEPDYAQYIAGVNNSLQKKAATWEGADIKTRQGRSTSPEPDFRSDIPFNIFATPDLVQHVMPKARPSHDQRNGQESSDQRASPQSTGWLPWQQ
ncbi:uncharacterized protein LOC143445303 isoform X2 [Clavelina lepadiformis]|uniref:uncharacterized protein LOC143445303 isoform X2 n=1 Tax=Clavelina lepadiformis TaxID=159417 RepID=UPI004043742E